MKSKTLLLTVLSAALIPFLAQAKPKGGDGKGERPQPGQIFERLDTDESGTLSKDEAKGPLAEHFDEFDANSDGEISKEELRAKHKERGGDKGGKGGKLKEIDTDESGTISLAEAEASDAKRLVEHFDKIDANEDGELTKEELKAAGDRMRDGKKGKKRD